MSGYKQAKIRGLSSYCWKYLPVVIHKLKWMAKEVDQSRLAKPLFRSFHYTVLEQKAISVNRYSQKNTLKYLGKRMGFMPRVC